MCGILSKINPLNITHGLVHTVATTPILDKAVPIALAVAGQPELAAAATGLEDYSTTRSIGKSLEGAGLSYAGNAIGSQLGNAIVPSSIGDAIGSTASNAVGAADAGINSALGQGFSQTASNALLNTGVGSALGGFAGGNFAQSLAPQKSSSQPTVDNNSLTPAPFTPTRAPQIQLPGSLSGLSSMTPDQQTSNLATQGVYGGGLGPQEQSYFTNLVNNQLVDPSGKVGNISSLSPIEDSYLSQLGLGGQSNSTDLLGAISKWQKQQQAA